MAWCAACSSPFRPAVEARGKGFALFHPLLREEGTLLSIPGFFHGFCFLLWPAEVAGGEVVALLFGNLGIDGVGEEFLEFTSGGPAMTAWSVLPLLLLAGWRPSSAYCRSSNTSISGGPSAPSRLAPATVAQVAMSPASPWLSAVGCSASLWRQELDLIVIVVFDLRSIVQSFRAWLYFFIFSGSFL